MFRAGKQQSRSISTGAATAFRKGRRKPLSIFACLERESGDRDLFPPAQQPHARSGGAEISEAQICFRMFGAAKQQSQSVSAGCQFEFLVCLQDLRDESTDIKTKNYYLI